MKIKSEFVLQKIGDFYYAIPTKSDTAIGSGMLKLNETGETIWKGISDGLSKEEIALYLTNQYSVSLTKATEDTEAFIKKLSEVGILEA